MSELENNVAPVRTQLTVSGIQADLNNGLSRPQIQSKYALSGKDMKDLFSHPKLKGLKTKPAPSFVLTDDTADAVEEVAEMQAPTSFDDDVQENNTSMDTTDFTPEAVNVEVEVEDEF